MKRKINIENDFDKLNIWIQKSIKVFNNPGYLDKVGEIYRYVVSSENVQDGNRMRALKSAHVSRDSSNLINLLVACDKFPYDEPFWYLMKNVKNFVESNPKQLSRITESLYNMTVDQFVMRIGSAPKLNQQTGPMFYDWIEANFQKLNKNDFLNSNKGLYVLDATEEEGKSIVMNILKQNITKRPDLVAKVNEQYFIGEAKWIGQSGGNQAKSVSEVIDFCKNQRGVVRRIGIIDGFPWATYNVKGKIINDKVCVITQESENDIMSALLLKKYLESFL